MKYSIFGKFKKLDVIIQYTEKIGSSVLFHNIQLDE